MTLLTASGLAQQFGEHVIFSQVSLSVHREQRIAIVGPNGRGKTTLMRILAGDLSPTAGQVSQAKNITVGYLKQDVALKPFSGTLYHFVETVFADLQSKQKKLNHLEDVLAKDSSLLDAYGEAQAAFELAGGYTYDVSIKQVLTGLGFPEKDYDRPLIQFSGGQQTRAHLARLLLAQPDLLLLDEPTNHLDLAASEWLEAFLKQWSGALIIISHDRYFLDTIINRVWELYPHMLDQYRGNYTHYRQQRLARWKRHNKEYTQQQQYIAQEEAYIKRNLAGRQSKQAQGRQKRLQRLKETALLQAQIIDKKMTIDLQPDLRSGDLVLASYDLVVGYPNEAFQLPIPDFEIRRGDRIALLGPNGGGKTTFLKSIRKDIPLQQGEVRLGMGVIVAYFAQIQDHLKDENTALDELLLVDHNVLREDARRHLGRFLFSGDAVFKKVGQLSGGERSRLALAKFTLSRANFLLLDEPTNHLDLPSQEILELVLADFSGTILFVSHDRYFIDALATQVWVIELGHLQIFEGRYRDYLGKDQPVQGQDSQSASATNRSETGTGEKTKQGDLQHQPEILALNKQILVLETTLSQIVVNVETAISIQNVALLQELGNTYNRTQTSLETLFTKRIQLENRSP